MPGGATGAGRPGVSLRLVVSLAAGALCLLAAPARGAASPPPPAPPGPVGALPEVRPGTRPQTPQAEPAPAPTGPPYLSPEVHPDRTVTFRIQAPRAGEVTLNGDWIAGTEPKLPKLAKGDKGVWSVTLGPLPPGLFIYSFNVDGVAMPDPLNPDVKLRARSAGSIVVVPGDEPGFWDARDVPRGTVEINWHRSAVLGQMRQLWVYLPPGYAKDRRRYPILYLLHGRNGTAADWTQAGLVNFVMDNLIAEKRAVPMVIVMPWLHALPFDAPPIESNDVLARYLLADVLPLVEGKYHVARDRAHRALFGLSLGGAAALTTGLNHPELFSHLASYSAGGDVGEIEKRIMPALAHPGDLNKQLELLWIGCGKQDPNLGTSEALAKLLGGYGVKVTFRATEGVHNWALWRAYFHETAPLLFRH
jgi:enterochelin esterase-like enzyme